MTDETEKPFLVIEARIADFERNFKTALRDAINHTLSEITAELHETSEPVETESERILREIATHIDELRHPLRSAFFVNHDALILDLQILTMKAARAAMDEGARQ